jgi:Lon protease-like protein
MFPLSSVAFPGLNLPLRVFEDRYRAMVHHLLRIEDPTERFFGTVAIREGWEVGEHGAQSLFRVGVRMQVTEIESHADGTFDLTAIGRDRIRLEGLETSGAFPVGRVSALPDAAVEVDEETLNHARATFTAYRAVVAELRGDPFAGTLPRDAEWLAWTLSAVAPLPLSERQMLLEADDAAVRLAMVSEMLRDEVAAINVLPSLPATEVARTRWSPN